MILIDNQDCWFGIGLSLQANAGDVGDGISVGTGISSRKPAVPLSVGPVEAQIFVYLFRKGRKHAMFEDVK